MIDIILFWHTILKKEYFKDIFKKMLTSKEFLLIMAIFWSVRSVFWSRAVMFVSFIINIIRHLKRLMPMDQRHWNIFYKFHKNTTFWIYRQNFLKINYHTYMKDLKIMNVLLIGHCDYNFVARQTALRLSFKDLPTTDRNANIWISQFTINIQIAAKKTKKETEII